MRIPCAGEAMGRTFELGNACAQLGSGHICCLPDQFPVQIVDRAMSDTAELTDIQTLRARARQDIQSGAVTPSYGADRDKVVQLLNEALATELVCVLRYKRHYFMAKGLSSQSVAQEFLQHAKEEEQHGDMIAERIVQLGGEPDFSPIGLAERSHAEYVTGDSLVDMIREDLVAERIAIDSYREMIQFVGDRDSTTRRMLEAILATEEEHAEDLVSFIEEIEKWPPRYSGRESA